MASPLRRQPITLALVALLTALLAPAPPLQLPLDDAPAKLSSALVAAFDLNELPPPEDEEELGAPAAAAAPAQLPGWLGRARSSAQSAWSAAVGKLPDYFSFEQFAAKLNRSYGRAERVYRKSRFLRTCMSVFRARVAFRRGKLAHLEAVNKFSDRSPNELRQMFMSGPPMEFRPRNQTERDYLRQVSREREARDRFDLELSSQALDVDGLEEEEAGAGQTVISEAQAERQIEVMLAGATLDAETSAAIRLELRGDSIETSSQADSVDADGARMPWPGRSTSANFASSVADVEDRAAYRAPDSLALANAGDSWDWSRHQCFHRIYDQGMKCGNCYVMASTTLAEFYKCSELEDANYPRQFSKQYVLDCAQKYSPAILGCMGGSLADTISFISQAGVHSIKGWTERRLQELRRAKAEGNVLLGNEAKCPFSSLETPFERWGDVRVQLNPRLVHPNDWLEALRDGPLVASVRMPPNVHSYAGGVHLGAGCSESKDWHAMVLVGYGRDEAGLAYWRFRNSYGPDWGDRGHFNLAMSVAGDCLVGGVRVFREPLEAPK